jgi:hypothetical protein
MRANLRKNAQKSTPMSVSRSRCTICQWVKRKANNELEMQEHDNVLLTVILAHPTGIFVKSRIKHPMVTLFKVPMAPYCLSKGLGLAWKTHDVVAAGAGHLIGTAACGFDHADAPQSRPCLLGMKNRRIHAMYTPLCSLGIAWSLLCSHARGDGVTESKCFNFLRVHTPRLLLVEPPTTPSYKQAQSCFCSTIYVAPESVLVTHRRFV